MPNTDIDNIISTSFRNIENSQRARITLNISENNVSRVESLGNSVPSKSFYSASAGKFINRKLNGLHSYSN